MRQRLAREGVLRFSDFMREALYAPGGYYAAGSPQGFAGDYLTAPETTPLFGASLSRLATSTWRALGRPERFDVVDVGAGSGALLRDLLVALRAEDPDCAASADLAAIEVSEAALLRQARTLGGLTVRRARSLEAIGPIEGLVVANELLDALPFHLVTRHDGRLRELCVRLDGDSLAFAEAEPSEPRLEAEAPALEEGERAAVPLAAYDWVVVLGAALRRGVALIVDYPSDPRPDVRTYFRQTGGNDPLMRVGEQDVTAPLDFARLRAHAERAGLRVVAEQRQADFLEELGFGERVRRIGSGNVARPATQLRAASARNAARTVIDPEGMGNYSVLVLSRGLEE